MIFMKKSLTTLSCNERIFFILRAVQIVISYTLITQQQFWMSTALGRAKISVDCVDVEFCPLVWLYLKLEIDHINKI